MFFLANWKTILAVVFTAALAYGLHALDVYRLEDQQRSEIAAQVKADNDQCSKDKAITKGVSDAYEKQISSLDSELNSIKRVRPSACLIVQSSRSAKRNNAASGVAKPSQQNGVDSDALYDFARDSEGYRIQLIACQSFIQQTWANQGQ